MDVDTGRAVAEDVLANRREADVCNVNECCYPTLPLLAEELLAALDQLAAAEVQRDTLAEAVHRISEHVVVSEGEFPDDNCDWHCTAEIVSIARAALAAVAPTEAGG